MKIGLSTLKRIKREPLQWYHKVAYETPYLVKVYKPSKKTVKLKLGPADTYVCSSGEGVERMFFGPRFVKVIESTEGDFVYLFTHSKNGAYSARDMIDYWQQALIESLSEKKFAALCKDYGAKCASDEELAQAAI